VSKYAIHLTRGERAFLGKFVSRGECLARIFLHAWILLLCDRLVPIKVIMATFGCSSHQISDVRRRYHLEGLRACLKDHPRTGPRKKLTPAMEAELTALTCTKPPKGRKRWTLALLAKHYRLVYGKPISKSAVQRILHAHRLKPWKKKMWCIPKVTPEFLARMYALLDLYAKPYNPAEPVVNVDEKHKQIQSHVRDPLPLRPDGHGNREDDHYKRNGSANIFVATNPLEGWRLVQVTARRTKVDYAAFLQLVLEHYPNASKVHIVADNLSTHTVKALQSVLGPGHPLFQRVELHYTPVHASWLNQVEVEIGVMDQQCTGRRFKDRQELESEVLAWATGRNAEQARITWGYTRAKAMADFEKTPASA
jgi:transposase